MNSNVLEGLFALLATSAPCGVSRSEACRAIWPKTESSQSLRQAISALRKLIGTESIEVTLDGYRLTTAFVFRCDLTEPALRDADVFMPSWRGEWFDSMRLETEGWNAQEEPQTAMDGFVVTLRWLARSDPRGFFDLMRNSVNLSRGVEFRTLLDLMRTVSAKGAEAESWSLFWRATAEEDLSVVAPLLRQALRGARETGDALLASEVAVELGRAYSRRGRRELALQACTVAESIAETVDIEAVKINSVRLRGTVLCHMGEAQRGLDLLAKEEGFIKDNLSLAVSRSKRAFYLASVGRNREAAMAIDSSRRLSEGSGHSTVKLCCAMAEAVMASHEGVPDVAIRSLERINATSKSLGFNQFDILSADMLSKHYTHAGEVKMAAEKARSARFGRALTKEIPTPLDKIRVQSIPA